MNNFETASHSPILEPVEQLLQFIVTEEEKLKKQKSALSSREESITEAKAKLAGFMIANGVGSVRLERCGMTPSASTKTQIYRHAGRTEQDVVDYFRMIGLENCVKESVHFQTMQSALKQQLEQDKVIDESLFNVIESPTIRINGRSAYLERIRSNT